MLIKHASQQLDDDADALSFSFSWHLKVLLCSVVKLKNILHLFTDIHYTHQKKTSGDTFKVFKSRRSTLTFQIEIR